jgi:hypothetical protein
MMKQAYSLHTVHNTTSQKKKQYIPITQQQYLSTIQHVLKPKSFGLLRVQGIIDKI